MGKAGVKNYVPFVRVRMVRERELPYAMEEIDEAEKVAAFTKEVSGRGRQGVFAGVVYG